MAYSGRVAVTPPGGQPAPASVEVGEDALVISVEGQTPTTLPFIDIEDLHDDNYTLRLTNAAGARYDLTMFGKAYGQIIEEVSKRRDDALQHDLLLTGVRLTDTFPGKLFGGAEPMPVEIRLFEDLMVVVPQRGTMWGLPYSFVEKVDWNEELYQTSVTDDEGRSFVFGHLAKRSEEFRNELRRLIDALRARTSRGLAALVPGLSGEVLTRLASVMRDGRAVQQWQIDAIDPSLWLKLEDAVVGTESLRESYETVKSRCPPGWAALGIKAVLTESEDADLATPPPADEAESAGAESGKRTHILWYFCPLSKDGHPINAVAQEITSEQGHATYVFRSVDSQEFDRLGGQELANEVAAGIKRLNRALLTLNFRREPIYLPDDQLATGPYSRYRVALRKLDYLRWTREAFLGRAIHNAGWEKQIEEAAGKA